MRKIKNGDKVIDILNKQIGYAIVTDDENYPIEFNRMGYTTDGKRFSNDINPSLLFYIEGYDYNNINFNNLPEYKRWRGKLHEPYYFIDSNFACLKTSEDAWSTDNAHYEVGNYFKTEEEAFKYINKMLKILEDNHE